MKNRLQFRHHSEIFETRENAIEYIYTAIRRTREPSMAAEDESYGFSLLGEPTILRYKNTEDEENPHIILAIGSVTNEGVQYADNQFCIIDIDKTESEIEELWEEIERIVSGLTIVAQDTNTLKLHTEATPSGTLLSGDVALAESKIFDNVRLPNRIIETEDGLFMYVNLTYDEDRETFTFSVNNAETGQLDKTSVKLPNNYLVSGTYSVEDESLHLNLKDGSEIVVNLENLIAEWYVEGEASKTPIVLTKEDVGYGDIDSHNHVEPWQDVLRADIRLADMNHNILKKTTDGRYLYVDGMADNIAYFKDGVEMTVADALNNFAKGASSDNNNILYIKPDGFFASASLRYLTRENTLVFTTSNVTGGTTSESIKLNSFELFKEIYYDSATEELVIIYVDNTGEVKSERIPIGEMLVDWEWDIQNEGHNIKLHKLRVVGGNDKVSADAAILDAEDNILEDKYHQLYVKGTADNIKFGEDSNVKEEINKLFTADNNINLRLDDTIERVDTLRSDIDAEISRSTSEDSRIDSKLDEEIARSTAKDDEHDAKISTIENTIGDGFSTDSHETITYRFNKMSATTDDIAAEVNDVESKLQTLSAKTDSEITRATSEEERIEQKFDDEIGNGFTPRNTVRDEIDALTSRVDWKLSDIVNNDHSIGIDKSNYVTPIVKVNLSNEIEDGKVNIIKLNNDGLYVGVDLDYSFNEETGSNQLTFKTTYGTKVFDLKTNSVVDRIYYDPTREAIIVEYTVNGHRMPDVVIPVGDLINEWRVSDSTSGAIKLTKTRESGSTQDVLYAETIVSDRSDNILTNNNGALYVSNAEIVSNTNEINALKGRMATAENSINEIDGKVSEETNARISADTALNTKIENKVLEETNARISADTALNTKIDAEVSRSTAKDAEQDVNITTNASNIATETTRATNAENALTYELHQEEERATIAENALSTAISGETNARQVADGALQSAIETEASRSIARDAELNTALNNEISARTSADSTELNRALTAEGELRVAIDSEVSRSTLKDADLDNKISAEISAREAADEALQAAIDEVAHTNLESSTTVRIDKTNPNVWKAYVISSNANNNLIVANEQDSGIYATVSLSSNTATNKLALIGTNGEELSNVDLGAGSIVDSINYDSAIKSIVIVYHDASGTRHELTVPAADLFNEWDVKNPLEGSAVELTKIPNTGGETGTIDYISARVLVSNHDANALKIIDNALFVDGSNSGATEEIACVKGELKAVERATLGQEVSQECGQGYQYTAPSNTTYISDARSMYDADIKLDAAIDEAYDAIDEVEANLNCVSGETKAVETVLGVTGGNCSTPIAYPKTTKEVLSAATSYAEADAKLEEAILNASVKLSHGRGGAMSDAELTITNSASTEYTDTNVLRMADIPNEPSWNGLYLSNVWDCGEYADNFIDNGTTNTNLFNQRYSNGVRNS